MRIVLDTGVLVRANARSKGPARELLTAILNGPHTLISSPFLLAETERVLYYPRLRATLRLNEEDIREHLEFIRGVSELVEPAVTEPVVLSDPDDDPSCSLPLQAVPTFCAAWTATFGTLTWLNSVAATESRF